LGGLVLANGRKILVSQLKQYKLCRRCLERHGVSPRIKPSEPCYICRGLMENLNTITDRILSAIRKYQFNTFLIGAILPTQAYEREDAMRARLKIRGRESIKNHLTRELGIRLAKSAKRKVDYLRPDLTISLAIDKDNCVDVTTKSRPLVFLGRYIKKQSGLPQKQGKCADCDGKGCSICDHSGLSGYESVEGVIAKKVIAITKGQTPKFSWIGSEDQKSLVLGKGRPFYARIHDPQKRNLKKIRIKSRMIESILSVKDEMPDTQSRFTVKTRIQVRCEKSPGRQDLKRLTSLSGSEVSFQNRSKTGTKKIYSARVRPIDSKNFYLTIIAEGGLMIKQFVGGEEYMKPNISEILNTKCECVTFDILDVQFQDSPYFREIQ